MQFISVLEMVQIQVMPYILDGSTKLCQASLENHDLSDSMLKYSIKMYSFIFTILASCKL